MPEKGCRFQDSPLAGIGVSPRLLAEIAQKPTKHRVLMKTGSIFLESDRFWSPERLFGRYSDFGKHSRSFRKRFGSHGNDSGSHAFPGLAKRLEQCAVLAPAFGRTVIAGPKSAGKPGRTPNASRGLELEAWGLELLWCLDVGAWMFALKPECRLQDDHRRVRR